IDGQQYTVIGLYHYTASPMGTPTSAGGSDSPKAIAPLETGRRHMNLWVRGNNLIVKPRDGVALDEAVDDVTAFLRGYRRLRPADRTNFAVVTQDRLLDVYNQLFGTFFVVGIALSSVGLLVGGIGVIAIMMISVTERAREIGVRKALGAPRGTILWRFLCAAGTPPRCGAAAAPRAGARLRAGGADGVDGAVGGAALSRLDAALRRRVGASGERSDRSDVRDAPGDSRGQVGSGRCS